MGAVPWGGCYPRIMNGEADLITVFRSADDDAHEEAEAIVDLLSGEGLAPVLLDDSAPGVPEGAYQVRVPPEQSARAEELIGEAHLPDDELTNVNETSDMDMKPCLVRRRARRRKWNRCPSRAFSRVRGSPR